MHVHTHKNTVYKDYNFTDVSEERDPTLLDGFDPDGKKFLFLWRRVAIVLHKRTPRTKLYTDFSVMATFDGTKFICVNGYTAYSISFDKQSTTTQYTLVI